MDEMEQKGHPLPMMTTRTRQALWRVIVLHHITYGAAVPQLCLA